VPFIPPMIAEVQNATFEDYLQEELAKLDLSDGPAPERPPDLEFLKTERIVFAALRCELVPYDAFLRLGFSEEVTLAAVEKRFRKLSKTHHPDRGGSQAVFNELAEAKEKCVAYLKARRSRRPD
jgi:hypothetical protein